MEEQEPRHSSPENKTDKDLRWWITYVTKDLSEEDKIRFAEVLEKAIVQMASEVYSSKIDRK